MGKAGYGSGNFYRTTSPPPRAREEEHRFFTPFTAFPRRRWQNCRVAAVTFGQSLRNFAKDYETWGKFGDFLGRKVVLPQRFELWTSPLPRECSTPELRQLIASTTGVVSLSLSGATMPQGLLPTQVDLPAGPTDACFVVSAAFSMTTVPEG